MKNSGYAKQLVDCTGSAALVSSVTGSGMMAAASHIHTYLEQSSCTTED